MQVVKNKGVMGWAVTGTPSHPSLNGMPCEPDFDPARVRSVTSGLAFSIATAATWPGWPQHLQPHPAVFSDLVVPRFEQLELAFGTPAILHPVFSFTRSADLLPDEYAELIHPVLHPTIRGLVLGRIMWQERLVDDTGYFSDNRTEDQKQYLMSLRDPAALEAAAGWTVPDETVEAGIEYGVGITIAQWPIVEFLEAKERNASAS